MIEKILEQLKSGEIQEYLVKKEDFMAFREVLINREDFKHFQGTAQRGGDTVYRYFEEARR